jgi:hypothetical protein
LGWVGCAAAASRCITQQGHGGGAGHLTQPRTPNLTHATTPHSLLPRAMVKPARCQISPAVATKRHRRAPGPSARELDARVAVRRDPSPCWVVMQRATLRMISAWRVKNGRGFGSVHRSRGPLGVRLRPCT